MILASIRTVFCPGAPPAKRHVPLAVYVTAVKRAKAQPDVTFKHGLTTWWPTTGAEIVEQFRRGMIERIDAAVPHHARAAGAATSAPEAR